jgi:hypothetical protein
MTMKKAILLFVHIIAFLGKSDAQIFHPVHWSYGFKKIDATEVVLFLKADIDEGWHIYSAFQKDGGPVRTSFVFAPSAGYSLDGDIGEPQSVTKYEKSFEMNVSYFEKQVIFQQKIHIRTKQVIVKGGLKYMVCNDKQCLPPETVSFEIPVK